MHYEVIRPFSGLLPGEIVSDEGWPSRRAVLLVDQRLIRPVTAAPVPAVTPTDSRKTATSAR